MSERLRSRWSRWLDRRIPRARQVTLDQRRIFIAPSPAGGWFLAALALMWLVAINYQNNLALGLVFLLFSVLVVSILHTYGNLAGLALEGVGGEPTFAGERALFRVRIHSPGRRDRHAIGLGWPGQAVSGFSLIASEDAEAQGSGGSIETELFHDTRRRGLLRPGRLLLQSTYPLGLIRAWTWVDLDLTALIYPAPIVGPTVTATTGAADPDGRPDWQPGSDDFHGFRPYRAGDNPRHVLWRTAARDQPLQTLQFVDAQVPTEYLSWDAVSGDAEQRLGKLCHQVLECARQQRPFGLALPGSLLAPAADPAQRDRALARLALFGMGEVER